MDDVAVLPSRGARPALVAVLLGAACLFVLFVPWHGPVVLALSERHGIDVGDLPALPLIAFALALVGGRRAGFRAERTDAAGNLLAAALALGLGALLIVGIFDPKIGSPLVPVGGGTFDGSTERADGRQQEPVGRWSDLALTYDGATLRLYVNGIRVSSQAATGSIRATRDPLWIGGNQPYGEDFHGAVDEVRVYNRALGPAAVRDVMSTPIRGPPRSAVGGLVAAYAFDAGSGARVADASGEGNTGKLSGAAWTRSGRFGGAINFDGPGQVVRVPASASLNLGKAMTLAAWVRPSEAQSGWRTVVARQRDAYFLMAGGGREHAGELSTLDNERFALLVIFVFGCLVALARGRLLWGSEGRPSYLLPVLLLVAGSIADVALSPSSTLIGPALVAIWWARVASNPDETLIAYVLAGLFAAVSVLSEVDPSEVPLDQVDGGLARAAALGLLLVAAGLLRAKRAADVSLRR